MTDLTAFLATVFALQIIGLVIANFALKDDRADIIGGWLFVTLWPLIAVVAPIQRAWTATGVFVHIRRLSAYFDAAQQASDTRFEQRAGRIWWGTWRRSTWYFIRVGRDRGLTIGHAHRSQR